MKKSSKIRNKYDIKDLQRLLGISHVGACRFCKNGTIRASKIAGKWYIEKRDLNNYLNRGSIWDKPEKVILDTIKGAIREAQEENIKRLEIAVKEKIISELESNIKKNLVKVDHNNIKLTEFVSKEINKQLEKKTEAIKKQLQKVN